MELDVIHDSDDEGLHRHIASAEDLSAGVSLINDEDSVSLSCADSVDRDASVTRRRVSRRYRLNEEEDPPIEEVALDRADYISNDISEEH
jgi:hypothetical protein